jgi:hypothetical protein
LPADIIALVPAGMAGIAVLPAGVALVCCADSDLLLEHAENPTAAIAANPTANVFVCTSFIALRSLDFASNIRRCWLPFGQLVFGAVCGMDGLHIAPPASTPRSRSEYLDVRKDVHELYGRSA